MTACDWFLLMMSPVQSHDLLHIKLFHKKSNNILLHTFTSCLKKKHHYDITMTSHHQLISSPSDSMLMIYGF